MNGTKSTILCTLLAAALLAGCSNPRPPPIEVLPGDEEPCVWTRSQYGSVTIDFGMFVVRNPVNGGFTSNGRGLDFPWLRNGDNLRSVNITVTWQVPTGGQEQLHLTVDDGDESNPPWRYKVFEGPSPIHATIAVNSSAELGEHLDLSIGTAHESPTPFGSVALVDQEVDVKVQQTYVC